MNNTNKMKKTEIEKRVENFFYWTNPLFWISVIILAVYFGLKAIFIHTRAFIEKNL